MIFVSAKVTTIGSVLAMDTFEKKGVEYMRIKNYTFTILPENAKFDFTNLFNGDKRLGIVRLYFILGF